MQSVRFVLRNASKHFSLLRVVSALLVVLSSISESLFDLLDTNLAYFTSLFELLDSLWFLSQ